MNKSITTFLKYLLCTLAGIYCADMIYRFFRYIHAYKHSEGEFSGIFGTIGEILKDSESFMIISAAACLLIIITAIVLKAFSTYTLICFILNFASGAVFVSILNYINIPVCVFTQTAIITLGTYLFTGLCSMILSIIDLCQNIFKIDYRRNNQ